MRYNKHSAIKVAKDFIEDIRSLEKKHHMRLCSDDNGSFFVYTPETGKIFEYIPIIMNSERNLTVLDETEKLRKQALDKLTPEEREALGI